MDPVRQEYVYCPDVLRFRLVCHINLEGKRNTDESLVTSLIQCTGSGHC